jgi:hypothetical protein
MCQHVLGAACLGRECQRGCVRARGVRALESGRHQVFTDDEVEEFYEEWEFNEADPGRIEFRHLVREIEHRLLKRIDGVTRLAADTFPAQDADGKESTHG